MAKAISGLGFIHLRKDAGGGEPSHSNRYQTVLVAAGADRHDPTPRGSCNQMCVLYV